MSATEETPRGFVPMNEYLRLRRRCDELEGRLALREEDDRDDADEDLVNLFRKRLGLRRLCARLLVVMLRSRRPMIMGEALAEALGTSSSSVNVTVTHLRTAVGVLGGPENLISAKRGCPGRWLSDEGRAWLKERVPEAFERGRAA